MARIIIGLTGEMLSGKTSVAEYLMEKHDAQAYRFSTILRDIEERLGLEASRGNHIALSTMLRKEFGEDLLARVLASDAKEAETDIIVIDGIRRPGDIVHLKDLPEFKLVYLESSLETRYDRVTRRNENSDDQTKTFEEFKKDHATEAERTVPGLKAESDIVLENEKTIENLFKEFDELVRNV